MYCSQCGKPIDDRAAVCVHCGSAVYRADMSGKLGWMCIGSLAPEAGIALYFVWKESLPLRAQSVGIGTIIGMIIRFLMILFIFLIM